MLRKISFKDILNNNRVVISYLVGLLLAYFLVKVPYHNNIFMFTFILFTFICLLIIYAITLIAPCIVLKLEQTAFVRRLEDSISDTKNDVGMYMLDYIIELRNTIYLTFGMLIIVTFLPENTLWWLKGIVIIVFVSFLYLVLFQTYYICDLLIKLMLHVYSEDKKQKQHTEDGVE